MVEGGPRRKQKGEEGKRGWVTGEWESVTEYAATTGVEEVANGFKIKAPSRKRIVSARRQQKQQQRGRVFLRGIVVGFCFVRAGDTFIFNSIYLFPSRDWSSEWEERSGIHIVVGFLVVVHNYTTGLNN